MRSLKGNDTIQVIPMARFCAWRNFVESAEINVICEEQGDDSPISPLSRALSGLSDPGRGVYRKLDQEKHEIRLIHILPGPRDDTLRCWMSYISLQDPDATPYECISYCWGGLQDSENIAILPETSFSAFGPSLPTESAHMLPITKNLYTALQYLRANGEERVLWVDALCINQRNLSERGAQVAMMRQIFAKSTNTVIWVGESDQETADLLRAAVKVGEHYSRNQERGLVASMHTNSGPNYLHRIHASIKDVYEDWGALDFPLFQREWFKRTWVIQEVFSARSTMLQCGDVVVPWSLILRINSCMHRPAAWTTPWRRTVIPDIHLQLFDSKKYTVDPLAREFSNPRRVSMTDILDVLLYGMDLEASDPRDKVFALLGFLDKESDEDLEDEIKPNYNKSVSRVFADFTRWWIRTHNSLRILSAVHANAGRTWHDMGIPSPTVKHTARPTWSLWHDGRSSWANATSAAWETTTYNASPGHFAHVLPSPSEILSVEGCILGKIESISSFPYFAANSELNELRKVYAHLFEPTNARNVWTSSPFQPGERDETGENLVLAQDMLYDHAYAHVDFLKETGGAIQRHHSCLVTTSEGSQGLCPPMARVEDLVVILFGGRVPYILRASNSEQTDQTDTNRYEFV